MAKMYRKKYSLRIDHQVRLHAMSYAKRKGWTLGDLILHALRTLQYLPKTSWERCVPATWPEKRNLCATSVTFPATQLKLVDEISKTQTYSFSKVVEIALWYCVDSLKRQLPKRTVAKRSRSKRGTVLYKCTDCQEIIIKGRYEEESNEIECLSCGGRAMILSKSYNSYYNQKLNKMLKYLQYGSDEVPDISDVDADILKRFIARKLKQGKREFGTSENIPNVTDFIPLFGHVYPKWAKGDRVVVRYKQTGIVYRIQTGKVYIEFDDEDRDRFPAKGKRTKYGGTVLGRAV